MRTRQKGTLARVVSNLAVISLTSAIVILLLSFTILKGFKNTIQAKLFNYDSHIQINYYSSNQDYHAQTIKVSDTLLNTVRGVSNVAAVSPYAMIGGILRANGELAGIALKGVDTSYNPEQFMRNNFKGRFLSFDNQDEVVISRTLANKLKLSIDDEFFMSFFVTKHGKHQERNRKIRLVGIYHTGLEDLDQRNVIGSLGLIQQINGWQKNEASGLEVIVSDVSFLSETTERVQNALSAEFWATSITEKYFHIFDWLSMISQNVNVLIVIVFIISFINIISIMYILIMEKKAMVGLLKALGAPNRLVTNIFLFVGLRLVGKSMLIANVLAIGFAFMQRKYAIIPLDEKNYYMTAVPVAWDLDVFAWINVVSLVVATTIILIPGKLLSRITPIKAIRFT